LLFDEYLKLIPDEKRTSDSIKEIYQKEAAELKINSFAYENLQKNITKFDNDLVNDVLKSVVYRTTVEAIRLKDEQILSSAITANDQLLGREEFPQYYQLPRVSYLESKEKIYIRYYYQTGEMEKFIKYATDLCNNKLMKISPDSLYKKDKANIQLIQHLLTSDKGFASQDSTNLAKIKMHFATAETFKVSTWLYTAAWDFFQKVSDVNILKEALRWSDRALELTPQNHHFIMTNANLHYKLGQKEEAITKGEQALRFADKNNIEEYKDIEDDLLKIKAGEKTWE
jgi:tetratricopeptide (TPR) repeat protein